MLLSRLQSGLFPPLRIYLRLDNHSYSPSVLQMIAEAARFPSFTYAAASLKQSGVKISSRHVHRMAVILGCELVQQRDRKVALHRVKKLPGLTKTIH